MLRLSLCSSFSSCSRFSRALLTILFAAGSALAAGCGSSARTGFDDDAGGVSSAPIVSPGDGGFQDRDRDGGRAECDPTTSADLAGCPCSASGETRACYTGPGGSRGAGICHDGTQTCGGTSEFGAWGACTGSILPTTETCASSVDSNCDGKVGCADPACATDPSCVDAAVVDATVDAPPACVATGSEATSCSDGVDNDCDGLVDCADPDCSAAPACCVPNTTVDGTIWANSPTELYRIDPTTFAVTTVGDFDAAWNDLITDVAVTPAGELYGVSTTTLYAIDKTTAKATEVASLSGSSNNALTFLPGGQLLGADGWGDVKRITPGTGASNGVGNYGSGLVSAGDMVAIADGTMYAISSTTAGGGDASGNNVLIKVDEATGAATVVGPIGHGNVWGLAYANGRVIGFTTAGKILQIDPATGAATVLSNKSIEFWGAGQSPLVSSTSGCP